MPLIERLEEYTNHPWIAFILGLSATLFVLSGASQVAISNGAIAGFLAVYGVLTLGIAVFMFLSSQALRLVSLRRMSG
jgi:tagatose-1,6-bisphosphate aldolase